VTVWGRGCCIFHAAFYIYRCSQRVMTFARRSTKAEVRPASPRESASAPALCPGGQRARFVNAQTWPCAGSPHECDQRPHFMVTVM